MKVKPIIATFCLALTGFIGAAAITAVQETDKLVYADFETSKDGRPISNGGGLVQLTSYQESPTLMSRYKGMEGSNPPAPELVRISKDSTNKAITFEYELLAPNQYAGVGVEIQALADRDGKPISIDVNQYKFLSLQLYVTGVQSIRVEFSTRGQGVPKSNANPQMIFKIKPGLNTYQIPLKNLSQPSWADVKLSPKDVLKKLTSVSVVAFCDQCTPTKGTVVVDNLVFQN
jgi:hypothetical protein